MPPSIDINAVKTALPAYFEFRKAEIFKQLFFDPESDLARFRALSSTAQMGNSILNPNFEMTEVMQGYQKAYTPKGTFSVGLESTIMRRLKINNDFDLEEFLGTQMGEWYDETKDGQSMTIAAFIVGKLIEAANADQLKYIYKGVYSAPVVGTPNNAANIVDGLEKMMADANALAKLQVLPMGAIPAVGTGLIEKYLYDAAMIIPEIAQNQKLIALCAPEVARGFVRDKHLIGKYSGQFDQSLTIDGTMFSLAPMNSMIGKKKIIFVHPDNLVRYYHRIDQTTDFLHVYTRNYDQPDVFSVNVRSHLAFGVCNWKYLWATDQV